MKIRFIAFDEKCHFQEVTFFFIPFSCHFPTLTKAFFIFFICDLANVLIELGAG